MIRKKMLDARFYLIAFGFCISFSAFYGYAQMSSSEVTIVSVGKAQAKKTKIQLRISGCTLPEEKKALQAAAEITRNDFSFYRHLRQIDILKENENWSWNPVTVAQLKSTGYEYLISWSCHSKKARSLKLVGVDLTMATVLVEREVTLAQALERSSVHRLDDDLYQAFFKQPSVFTSHIVFVAAETWGKNNSVKELYQMDFDGYNIEKLTSHGGIAISPAYSPDNTKIIYSLIDSKKRIKNISLYELDVITRKSKLVLDKVGINSGAVYSADGRGIYLTMSFNQNADIYYVDLSTKAQRRITNKSSEDVDPSVTRDGKSLAFLSNRFGSPQVFVLDPTGEEKAVERKSYVGSNNATPRFTPDGSEIIFSSWVDGGFNIYRLSIHGELAPPLTSKFGSNEDPSYSLDGQFIAFTSNQSVKGSREPDQKLYIMNRHGEILGPLTKQFVLCSSPRFSN